MININEFEEFSAEKIDIEIIKDLIQLNNKRENFFHNQLLLFKQNSDNLIYLLNNEIKDNNKNKIKEIIHSLQGACANFGAIEVSNLLREIYNNCYDIDKKLIEHKMLEIKNKIQEFVLFLTKIDMNINNLKTINE